MGGLREAETLFGVAEALVKKDCKEGAGRLRISVSFCMVEPSIRKRYAETIGCLSSSRLWNLLLSLRSLLVTRLGVIPHVMAVRPFR
jgi:hypothetical protein